MPLLLQPHRGLPGTSLYLHCNCQHPDLHLIRNSANKYIHKPDVAGFGVASVAVPRCVSRSRCHRWVVGLRQSCAWIWHAEHNTGYRVGCWFKSLCMTGCSSAQRDNKVCGCGGVAWSWCYVLGLKTKWGAPDGEGVVAHVPCQALD